VLHPANEYVGQRIFAYKDKQIPQIRRAILRMSIFLSRVSSDHFLKVSLNKLHESMVTELIII
jgi:hypothetical protein